MAYFQTKNPDLGMFWRVLQFKMFVYYMAMWSTFPDIWYILWPFGIFNGYLVNCNEKNLATLHATRSKLSQMLFAAL
jgi:hypothetical protein